MMKRFGRIANYAKIGIATAALQVLDRQLSRKYLLNQLAQIPGVPSKLSQILIMKSSLEEVNEPKDQVLSIEQVKSEIEKKAPKLSQDLSEISEIGVSASLGQVHWGRLKDGSEIAIKIQYPFVKQSLNEQLEDLLFALDRISKSPKFSLDSKSYSVFLKNFFDEELDYDHEAKAQSRFRQIYHDPARWIIPEVKPVYCTSEILVQSYEESKNLYEMTCESLGDQHACAARITEFVIHSIFVKGVMHADLHPKNWGYRYSVQNLVLYDFGATMTLESSIRDLLKFWVTQGVQSPMDGLELFTKLGFDPIKLTMIADRLPMLSQLLLEPLAKKDWKANQWNIHSRIDELLGPDKWFFRNAGPPWFLIFMRSLAGWVHALGQLQNDVSVREIYLKSVSDKISSLDFPLQNLSAFNQKSNSLKVRVCENGAEVVSVELPARAIEDMENLLPDHVAKIVKDQGIDLIGIKNQVLAQNLQPQVLFETQSGIRTYKVWLE